MLEILNPKHVFCAECLYKTHQDDEYPCNQCAIEENGMDATEYSPAGTQEKPAGEYKPAGTPEEVL